MKGNKMTQQRNTPTLVSEGKMSATLKQYGEELAQVIHLNEQQKQKAFGMAIKLSRDTNLQNVSQNSLIAFCFEVARHNFIRDDALYPVPYKQGNIAVVQAQAGYKALKEETERSGKYRLVDAVVVKEVDKVGVDALTSYAKVVFEKDFIKRENSKVIGYYAFAIKRNERRPFISEFWTVEKVEAHRDRYSKKNQYGKFSPAWENNFDAMAMKTVFKSLGRKLDITPELESLIRLDQIVFDENGNPIYLDNPQTTKSTSGSLYVEALQTTPTSETKGEITQKEVVDEDKEIEEIVKYIENEKNK
jgi:phage RecT family recombinase